MKSLKAKNILLSLLTMLAITITMTSCEQESVVIPDAEVMEMTTPEVPDFIKEHEGITERNSVCDHCNPSMSNISYTTHVSGVPNYKTFGVAGTGVTGAGCVIEDLRWYVWGPNANVAWAAGINDQSAGIWFNASGGYWVAAYMTVRDASGGACTDLYKYVYVTI